MKVLFIVALLNVKLPGNFGRGLRLSDTHFLTNDPAVVSPLLTEHFERLAGILEANAIRKAPAVIYGITEHDAAAFKDHEARRFLNEQLVLTQLFLMALWLVKDNAANVELGFLEHPHRDLSFSSVSSNSRAIRFSDASGGFPLCEFAEVEVKAARDIYVNLFDKNTVHVDLGEGGRTVPSDSSRLERVLYFAQGARGSSDLGVKIAAYVTCFESLFCTDSSELAHKLAERVAFFCGDTAGKRFDVFRTAKTAYTIRSKTVHGDRLSAKLSAQAKAVALECDTLLRTALDKILGSREMHELFVGAPERLEEYLTGLVFGAEGTSWAAEDS